MSLDRVAARAEVVTSSREGGASLNIRRCSSPGISRLLAGYHNQGPDGDRVGVSTMGVGEL